jgi:hypothetical protein
MAAVANKYRIACLTDSSIEYDWSLTTPTVCPINPGHTIGPDPQPIEEELVFLIDNTNSPYKLKVNSVFGDTNAANVVIMLPPSENAPGARYVIKNVGSSSNFINITPNVGDTIDNTSSYSLEDTDQIVIKGNNNNWDVIAVRNAEELEEIERSTLLLLANVCLATLDETTGIIPSAQLGSIDNHTDVTVTNPQPDQLLQYDGSNWVNSNINVGNTTLANTGAGTYNIVADGVGPDLLVKSFSAGANAVLTDISNVITIDAIVPITILSGAGTGENLVVDGTGPSLEVKNISGGTDISATTVGNDIVVNYVGISGNDVTLAGAGTGENLVVDGTGPSLEVKNISGGTDISATTVGNDIVVNYVGISGNDVTLSSTGVGTVNIVSDSQGPTLAVKSFEFGANISVTDSSNVIDIDAVVPITTLTSVGNGIVDLVVDGIGPDLSILSVDVGNGIDLEIVGNSIEISTNLDYIYLANIDTVSTTSTTNVPIPGMLTTPPAGTWYVQYSGSGEISTGSLQPSFSIRVDGTVVLDSIKFHGWGGLGGARVPLQTQSVINVDGTQLVETVYTRGINGGGQSNYTMYNRNMLLIRLA